MNGNPATLGGSSISKPTWWNASGCSGTSAFFVFYFDAEHPLTSEDDFHAKSSKDFQHENELGRRRLSTLGTDARHERLLCPSSAARASAAGWSRPGSTAARR